MKTRHPAIFPILVTNFKGAFNYGYRYIDKGGFKGSVLPFIHTLFLPITLTFGVAIKTIIDVRSRQVLPSYDLTQLKMSIYTLNEDDLNKKISCLYKIQTKSNSSTLLIKNLWKEKCRENKNYQQLLATKLNAQKRELEISEYRRLKLDHYPKVSLPREIEDKIVRACEQKHSSFKTERITIQRKLLLGFLEDPRNAGKKTQHVLSQLFNM